MKSDFKGKFIIPKMNRNMFSELISRFDYSLKHYVRTEIITANKPVVGVCRWKSIRKMKMATVFGKFLFD